MGMLDIFSLDHMTYLLVVVQFLLPIQVSRSHRKFVKLIRHLSADRDGSIDIIFPTCTRKSASTGLGRDCSINIAHNKQVPLCSTEVSQWNTDGLLRCRGWGDMCLSHEKFEFSFDESDPVSQQASGNDVILI